MVPPWADRATPSGSGFWSSVLKGPLTWPMVEPWDGVAPIGIVADQPATMFIP